jgi:transcription antitermination factor NusG
MGASNSVIQPESGRPDRAFVAVSQTADANNELRWYAVYTRSRHEKRVQQQLKQNVPECFLPLYEVIRRWKTGDRFVAYPLFPGYLFVRISPADRMRVVTTPGVVCIVGGRHGPTAIADQELDAFRRCFERQLRMEPHPYLRVGRRVYVRSGAFAGMQGILLRKKGKWRLIVSIDLIARSVAVEIDANDVAPLRIAA